MKNAAYKFSFNKKEEAIKSCLDRTVFAEKPDSLFGNCCELAEMARRFAA